MATVRTAIAEALRALRAVGPLENPSFAELSVGLEAAQNLVLDLHEARGPLHEVDAAANYVAGENQRVRVVAGDTITVTLPNSVAMFWAYDPYDYGFSAGVPIPPPGSTGPADNILWRMPRDGARIEVVGVTTGLWFYRADLNAWTAAYGLTLDAELPFNTRLTSAFEALLAERLADVVSAAQPSPFLLKRIARGRQAMMLQTGRERTRRVGEYL
jgi:hypothetical protein